MKESAFVYVPMDEDFDRRSFTYNSTEFPLEPNAVNELVSPWPEIPAGRLLQVCLEQLGRFGVRAIEEGQDAAAIQEHAEEIHAAYLRGKHGAVLASWDRTCQQYKDLGMLPEPEPAEVKTARKKLTEWGLISGLLLLLCGLAPWAEASQTKRDAVLASMWTAVDSFGPPGHATDPFACDANTKRSIYFNTTSGLFKGCDGSSWGNIGGLTSPVSGSYVWTGSGTWGASAGAINSIGLQTTTGCIELEGTTADAVETRICGAGSGGSVWISDLDAGPVAGTTSTNSPFHIFIPHGGAYPGGVGTFIRQFDGAGGPFIELRKARGTDPSALGAVQADDATGIVAFGGWDGSAYRTGVNLSTAAEELWTGSARGSRFTITVPANGSTTSTERFRISNDGTVYIGNGATAASPNAATVRGTGGSGTNIAGAKMTHSGGSGTGSGVGGALALATSQQLATGTTLQSPKDRVYLYAGQKALTAASATDVVRIALPQGEAAGGRFQYCVRASDATDILVRCGNIGWAAVNKSGTETCNVTAPSEVCSDSVTPGTCAVSTLTVSATCTSSSAETVDIELNAAATITETTLNVEWRLDREYGSGAITPQ